MGTQQKLGQLHLYPFLAHMDHIRRNYLDSFKGVFFYGKTQLGRKTDGPQYSQGILRKAVHRFTHAPDNALFQVIRTSEFIHKSPAAVIGHGIDGKIPAL